MGSKGGGGGGTTRTESTVVQSSLPEYAQPYYERMMERAEGLSLSDYTPYPGERQADIDPFSQSAYNMTSGIAGAGLPYADEAAGVLSNNIMGAMDQGAHTPYQFSPYSGNTPYSGFNQYGGFSDASGNATPYGGFQNYMFGDPRQFTDTGEAASYMSPYIENVLDDRMANIRRQYNMSQQTRDANAVQAGAFGGSRDAVVNSLAQEDLMRQLDDVYNEGLSSAYGQAMTQFNADRGAQMDTSYRQATENARYQTADAAELARTQGISLAEAARIQAAQAADSARVQSSQAAEAARVQGADAGELGRVQSAQAAEDYNAYQTYLQNLGFQGQQALDLVGVGDAQRAADIQSAQMLEQTGRSLTGYDQAAMDIAYDDFLRQQGFPESQLTLYSSLLQGVPISPTQTTTSYTPYDPMQAYLGAGLAGLGTYMGLKG